MVLIDHSIMVSEVILNQNFFLVWGENPSLSILNRYESQKTIHTLYCPFKRLCFFLGWICPGTNAERYLNGSQLIPRQLIIQTGHILQLDSAVTDSLSMGGVL
jgi:hypothetical protein